MAVVVDGKCFDAVADAKFKYLSLLMAPNVTFLLVSDFTGARIIAIYGVGVSVTVYTFH